MKNLIGISENEIPRGNSSPIAEVCPSHVEGHLLGHC